ncbi:MAG: hypothetical protein AAGE59_33055, partial [Cyanobacteria bacterium P01_F01_bin.86]
MHVFQIEWTQIYYDCLFEASSDGAKEDFIQLEQIESTALKIDEMIALMQEIATSQGVAFLGVILSNDEKYREKYKELDLALSMISRLGFQISNPNKFTSLWQWYSFWRSDLSSYAERRQYVNDLYKEILGNFRIILKKSKLATFSQLEPREIFKSRFKEHGTGALENGEEIRSVNNRKSDSSYLASCVHISPRVQGAANFHPAN